MSTKPKRCLKCGLDEEQTEFYPSAGSPCKPCRIARDAERVKTRNEYLKQWRRDKPEKQAITNRAGLLRRRYGMTPERYLEMLQEQGGRCAACRGDSGTKVGTFNVDHDHVTGAIRGLLCHHCNLSIGHAKESVDRLRELISYLEAHDAD